MNDVYWKINKTIFCLPILEVWKCILFYL